MAEPRLRSVRLERQPQPPRNRGRSGVEQAERLAPVTQADVRGLRPESEHLAERSIEQQRHRVGIRYQHARGRAEDGDDTFTVVSVMCRRDDTAAWSLVMRRTGRATRVAMRVVTGL